MNEIDETNAKNENGSQLSQKQKERIEKAKKEMANPHFGEKFSNDSFTFYYNRDERLQNAPDCVKAHYDGTEPKPPKGLFKALVHTKMSRYCLFALILVLALFVGLYFFGGKENENALLGTNYTLRAINYEDNVLISVKMDKIPQNEISVQILPIDNENLVTDKINFTKQDLNGLYFRTVFPNHDTIKVQAKITDLETLDEITLSTNLESE